MTFEERFDKFGNRFLTDGEKWALVSGKLFDNLDAIRRGESCIDVRMPVMRDLVYRDLVYGLQLAEEVAYLVWRLQWYVTDDGVKRPCYMVDDGKRMPEEWEYEYHMK